jgi:hypothetical protein
LCRLINVEILSFLQGILSGFERLCPVDQHWRLIAVIFNGFPQDMGNRSEYELYLPELGHGCRLHGEPITE